MFWVFYNVVFFLVYLLMLPHFLLRMKRRGNYKRNFSQRFGKYAPEVLEKIGEPGRIWIHAVSVGECNVALALMDQLRKRKPDARFILTVNTSTGYAMAEMRKHEQDLLLYPPVDLPYITRRAVSTLRPSCLCLIETEVWPNLLRSCKEHNVPTVLVNGRLSDRSTRRMERVKWLTQRVYALVDLFCMQSEEDTKRLIRLGANPSRIVTQHTAKYDSPDRNLDREKLASTFLKSIGFFAEQGAETILMGSSTWPGEELALSRVLMHLRQSGHPCKLLLVPRHAERTPEILQELHDLDLAIRCRNPIGETSSRAPDVFVLNSTGELRDFTSVADWVFVGKSLFKDEGQNPLEAAEMGKAVITGMGMNNFRAVMDDLRKAEAVAEVTDEESLKTLLLDWQFDGEIAKRLGTNAASLVASRRGVLDRTAKLISDHL